MNSTGALGRYGEDVAARYLAASGLQLLERNWRCREGELDIVARERGALVVCEVKTRSGTAYQHPLAAIGPVKARRLRHLTERWLVERWPRHAGGAGLPDEVRIDIVSVVRGRRGAAAVEHVRGVV
jgi:putative endonuclease